MTIEETIQRELSAAMRDDSEETKEESESPHSAHYRNFASQVSYYAGIISESIYIAGWDEDYKTCAEDIQTAFENLNQVMEEWNEYRRNYSA